MLDKFQCSESNKFYNNATTFIAQSTVIILYHLCSVITTESQDHQTGPSKVLWFDVHVCQLSSINESNQIYNNIQCTHFLN